MNPGLHPAVPCYTLLYTAGCIRASRLGWSYNLISVMARIIAALPTVDFLSRVLQIGIISTIYMQTFNRYLKHLPYHQPYTSDDACTSQKFKMIFYTHGHDSVSPWSDYPTVPLIVHNYKILSWQNGIRSHLDKLTSGYKLSDKHAWNLMELMLQIILWIQTIVGQWSVTRSKKPPQSCHNHKIDPRLIF